MRDFKYSDHCIVFALSDPKDFNYQATCAHDHSDLCGQFNALAVTLGEVEAVDGSESWKIFPKAVQIHE